MDTSDLDPRIRVKDVRFTEEQLVVDLVDGRTIAVPLEWYPRLQNADEVVRADWVTCSAGWGIHWPGVDEHVNTPALLKGKPSWEYVKTRAPAG